MDKKRVARGVGVGFMALAVTGVLTFSLVKAFRSEPPTSVAAAERGLEAEAESGARPAPKAAAAAPGTPPNASAPAVRQKPKRPAGPAAAAAPAPVKAVPRGPKVKVPEARRKAHAVFMLSALRSQIMLYQLQHDGAAPDFRRYPEWEQMLDTTHADGTLGAGNLGPYLRSVPFNPLNGHGRVAVVAEDVKPGQRVRAEGIGFVFSRASGRLWCTDAIGRVFNEAAAEGSLSIGSPERALSMVRAELHRLRVQVALYKLQHVDTPPDLRQHPRWAQLMQRTRADGKADPEGPFGPYLLRAPINALNSSSEVDVVERIPRTGYVPKPKKRAGYVYESNTGRVWATDAQWRLIAD